MDVVTTQGFRDPREGAMTILGTSSGRMKAARYQDGCAAPAAERKHMRSMRMFALVALLTTVASLQASAQTAPRTRHGFWLNFGAGAGSLGCQNCSTRENGFSGTIGLGGAV